MATIEFTIKMKCTVTKDEDDDLFVSHCPTLDLYSQGENEAEAVEAIKSAITLHLTTAFDFNRLDKVLRKHGFENFSPEQQSALPHPLSDTESVAICVKNAKEVPISLPLVLSSAAVADYASIA